MKLADVTQIVGDVPHMTKSKGAVIYNMIRDNAIVDILELGTAHGTSSCYMAAALDEKGTGSVCTIDRKSALTRKPNVTELLKSCNLETYVTPVLVSTSYNWELLKIIEQQTRNGYCEPLYDLCYIDGAHNFEIDCCAFFLVDKLMKPGGLILFDDLNWTYADSPSFKDTDWVKQMDEDEKSTPHIKKLVENIVMPHPNYSDFDFFEDWFMAKKRSDVNGQQSKAIKLDSYKSETSLSDDIRSIAKKVKKKLYTTINKGQ
jgi:predicted O-methyltransferase YrrM